MEVKSSAYKAPKAQFVPVVINNKLVFRFDPQRGLIEYQSRGEKHIIDLAEYAEGSELRDSYTLSRNSPSP